MSLSDNEKAIRNRTRTFVRDRVDRELVLKVNGWEEYSCEFIKSAGDTGLLGLRFLRRYGGHRLDWVHEVLALGGRSAGIALACAYSLLSTVGQGIHWFGTEEQKKMYLEPTRCGKTICGDGLTEPRGGSEFLGTNTVAIKEGDTYTINGRKRFVAGVLVETTSLSMHESVLMPRHIGH